MNDKQILKRCIQKAESNGYICPIAFYDKAGTEFDNDGTIDNGEWYEDKLTYSIQQIIFSHEFAKAFWGEAKYCKCSDDYLIGGGKCHCETNQGWEYHLQQIVLEKEPLKYLEKFL